VEILCEPVAVKAESFVTYHWETGKGQKMLMLEPEDLPVLFVQKPRGIGERYNIYAE